MNKYIEDIKARLICNLPVPGGIGDCEQRKQLEEEWIILEKRIEQYYILRGRDDLNSNKTQ